MMPRGEVTCRRIDDDAMMVQLPVGWWIEQQGNWYTAYFGEAQSIGPSTRLVALVGAIWWEYNRTGSQQLGVRVQ
jgi:hypothetical protein